MTEYFSPELTIDHNLYVRGNYVYLSNYESGLRILDINDISNPVEVAYFDTDPVSNKVAFEFGAWSSYPYFNSGIVVVSSIDQGLFVLQPTTLSVTAREQDVQVPKAFALRGNYPNPFNSSTRILLNLPESAEVTIDVIDLLGRKVLTLKAGTVEAGKNKSVVLDTGRLASGPYLYLVIAQSASNMHSGTGRMVLMK